MTKLKQGRWPLIKDAFIFQLKLGGDAFRDLLLSPISIACLIIDLIKGHPQSESYFHRLMNFGRKTDKWLNLFGSNLSTKENENILNTSSSDANVDQLFEKIETLLQEQHHKGGVTAAAKASIDRYLDKIMKKDALLNKKGNEDENSEKPTI